MNRNGRSEINPIYASGNFTFFEINEQKRTPSSPLRFLPNNRFFCILEYRYLTKDSHMARKWSYQPPPDSSSIEPGLYVLADPKDGHGERVFLSVRANWAGEPLDFLCDAASSLWENAPWALIPFRKAFSAQIFGSWEKAAMDLEPFSHHVIEASRSSETGFPTDSALIILRASVALKKSASSSPQASMDALAAEALAAARAKDRAILLAKKAEFLELVPGWEPA